MKKEIKLSQKCSTNGCKRNRSKSSLNFCSVCEEKLKYNVKRMLDRRELLKDDDGGW